jgi:hypothetical protein
MNLDGCARIESAQSTQEASMTKSSSEGVCQLCQGKFTKRTITRHLQKCVVQHELPSGHEADLFHLTVQGYGPYWLHVEMPGSAKLRDLDQFLRDIWLECCDHLSTFEFSRGNRSRRGLTLNPFEDFDSFEEQEERLMGMTLADVLEPQLEFVHKYDFGSTTELRLKVAGIRTGKWSGGQRVRLLARNLPPEYACGRCGKPAQWTETTTGDFYCDACAKKADEEEYLLPVVNSPRTGVCGYTG